MVDITAEDAFATIEDDNSAAVLIDIRREEEVAGVTARGAVHVPRDMLEMRLPSLGVNPDTKVLLMCQSGARSNYAARALRAFGYEDAWSVKGGFSRWREAALPDAQLPFLEPRLRERFARHISLNEMGLAGQAKLSRARVLLIGAGGLGSPAGLYLAAMGVGQLRIVDDDDVELSNLQRQVIHTEASVGRPKVQSAEEVLRERNSDVEIETVQRRFDSSCGELLEGVDVVVNGADNFKARYALNDLCLEYGVPLVDGALLEMEGQLSVFCTPSGPCYRCLYPQVPPNEVAPSCAAAGVLGVVPGIIGLLQALEAVKIIVGFGQTLEGRLATFDAATSSFQEYTIEKDPDCMCSAHAAEPARKATA